MEGRFFGKPYGRRSTRVEPSSARGVFESEAHMAAAGGRHLGDRRATPAPCRSDVTRHARGARRSSPVKAQRAGQVEAEAVQRLR